MPRRTACASSPVVEGRRHNSLDTAAELIGHRGPASSLAIPESQADRLGESQEVGKPEPRPAPGHVPVAVRCAQVGPVGGEAEDRAVEALKDDPALLTGVSPVKEGEALSAERMEGVGDPHRGIFWTVRSPMR